MRAVLNLSLVFDTDGPCNGQTTQDMDCFTSFLCNNGGRWNIVEYEPISVEDLKEEEE